VYGAMGSGFRRNDGFFNVPRGKENRDAIGMCESDGGLRRGAAFFDGFN
jgi:hypothetical protein